MVISLNIWTVVLSTSNRPKESGLSAGPIKYMDELACLQKENPLMAFTVAMSMFSIAGIPPLAGFCAKLYVFFAAMESSL
jgi:NADH:ubiquinone oxidoreductase subunit 2 (subunit N)